jgi:hypothetical protein
MKIVFDAGVIISFSETCFLPLFQPLKEKLGQFIITRNVKGECVDNVKKNLKYSLSALRVSQLIDINVFEVYENDDELQKTTEQVLNLTNNMFYVKKNPLTIIQAGEAQSLALLGVSEANYFAVDERTARMIIEQPHGLLDILKKKYNAETIRFDQEKYLKFRESIGNVEVVRSVDLLGYAFEQNMVSPEFRNREFLRSAMYSLKFRGCSASFEEIEEYAVEFK